MNAQPAEQDSAELMARHGIVRVEAIQYRYKSWRYSNLLDAIAQAKRDARTQIANAK